MNAFVDPDELVICPYDRNHSIMKGKIGFHLVKCRKNHTGAPIAICDYNQEHRVPKPELKYHHDNCEDRIAIEARPRALQDENVMSFPIISDILTPSDQVWNELDHPGYDSESKTDNSMVLRTIAVEKPSVKKQFLADETKRMMALRAPSIPSMIKQSESSSSSVVSSCHDEFVDEEKPECSLEDRLTTGQKTVYNTSEETEWKVKMKKKSKKNGEEKSNEKNSKNNGQNFNDKNKKNVRK